MGCRLVWIEVRMNRVALNLKWIGLTSVTDLITRRGITKTSWRKHSNIIKNQQKIRNFRVYNFCDTNWIFIVPRKITKNTNRFSKPSHTHTHTRTNTYTKRRRISWYVSSTQIFGNVGHISNRCLALLLRSLREFTRIDFLFASIKSVNLTWETLNVLSRVRNAVLTVLHRDLWIELPPRTTTAAEYKTNTVAGVKLSVLVVCLISYVGDVVLFVIIVQNTDTYGMYIAFWYTTLL